jgi:ATP adenylyltransferase
MDRLWAPWRIKYIKAKKQNRCIFCRAVKSRGKNYVIFKTGYSIAVLNIFPYNNGHVMLAPLRHIRDFTLLKEPEALDLFRSLKRIRALLEKVLKPQGYNIGINMAETAGAGITGHMHIHIVPRWKGDTNFMPILSGTKIIPESLDELYKRLKYAE